jgi:hypothetical protein
LGHGQNQRRILDPKNRIQNSSLLKVSCFEDDYPHHPQPKLATKKIQKAMVAMRYLSSRAMIYPP